MLKSSSSSLLFVFSLLLLFLISSVLARRGDEDARPRSVERVSLGSDLRLRSTLRNGNMKNRIDYRAAVESDKVRFQVEYRSGPSDANSRLSFEVRITKPFEYQESGVAAGYQPGDDQKVRDIDFGNWGNFQEAGTDAFNVTTYSVSTLNGRATLLLMVGPNAFSVDYANQSVITYPNTVKFTLKFNLSNYNYASSVDSRLGFVVKLESESDSDEDLHSAPKSVKLMHNGADDGDGEETEATRPAYQVGNLADPKAILGVFNWLSVAIVDGASTGFFTSNLTRNCGDSSGNDICNAAYWAVNAVAPRTFEWDPNVGVSTQYVNADTGVNNPPTNTSPAVSSTANMLLIVVLVLLAVVLGLWA